MILVNRNFGNPVLGAVIGDMFKAITDDYVIGKGFEWVNHTNTLASGSTLVAGLQSKFYDGQSYIAQSKTYFESTQTKPLNFFLVTEHFIKTLDKVYTKIWNESFTETGIYNVSNLVTIYNGFVSDYSLEGNSLFSNTYNNTIINFMLFKKFVDRCITAGILLEEDRLDYKDQISLTDLNKADLSTQIDYDNKVITFTASKPIDIKPDLNAMASEYLAGKKLYLMMTPYLTNESVETGQVADMVNIGASDPTEQLKQEPITNYFRAYNGTSSGADYYVPVKRPIAFFKPKTDASKFGRSLPLATHLIWSIGTPEDKEIALLEGKPVPDLIFDHLDRISHIDSLTLKIKFDKLQF